MPEHLVEINLGSWSIKGYRKQTIGEISRNNAPRLPGIYVVPKKRENYVGQSVDVFWRVRGHIAKAPPHDVNETVTFIFNTDIEMDRELLIHIEFGLMLAHLGSEHKLLTKQTDVPLGSTETRRRALDFFETVLCHYRVAAISIFGSQSPKNRRSLEDALVYLRRVWADIDDTLEDHLVPEC